MSVTTAAAGAAARGQALRSISGSLAMLAAMRRASSRVSSLAAARLLVFLRRVPSCVMRRGGEDIGV